ncbi:hypothetical protein ABPG74_002150 [Tetrahymena malaccensis]
MTTVLQSRLHNIKNMKLPFCKKQNHYDSQINELDMNILNPVCCVCRHDDIPDNSVVPIITILSDLARQLDLSLNTNHQRVQNMEPRFLEISRDFKNLSSLCDQLSQDILISLDNYKKTIQRDLEKEKVGKIIDEISKTDNYPGLKKGFVELQEYTVNEKTHLTLNRRRTEQFQEEVDQNAEVYVNTMQEIIRRLQDILGEMSEWSLIKATDGIPMEEKYSSPRHNQYSNYDTPMGVDNESYSKIEDYDVDNINPQMLRGNLDYLNNKILNIDFSGKIGNVESIESLCQFLAKVATDVKQLQGIKIDLKSWNLGDKCMRNILQGVSNVSENNNQLKVLALKFCDWNDNSDISVNALADCLRNVSKFNQQIELLSLNLECWHNCSEGGVQNLVQSLNNFLGMNRNLSSFQLNMRQQNILFLNKMHIFFLINSWKTCADDAVISLSSVIHQLGSSSRKLAHFNLNLYDWNKCTNGAANSIAKGLNQLSNNTINQLKTFVLELAYWKEATEVGANAIAKSINQIVQKNPNLTNFVANFYNWNLQSKEHLNALRQELSKNTHYSNFQLAY